MKANVIRKNDKNHRTYGNPHVIARAGILINLNEKEHATVTNNLWIQPKYEVPMG